MIASWPVNIEPAAAQSADSPLGRFILSIHIRADKDDVSADTIDEKTSGPEDILIQVRLCRAIAGFWGKY